MSNNLTDLSIVEAKKLIQSKNISCVELVKAHIEAAENDKLNAFIIKTPDLAI